MKTTIYMVRHCESEGNACRRNQARFDGVVTRKGLLQSQVLAERFRDIPVTAIYSSDAWRCRVSAQPLAQAKGLRVQYRMLLREYTIGVWEGLSIGYTASAEPERYARWLATPYDHDIPGADPFWLIAERGCEAVAQIARENPGGTVVAFTHSCTLNCMLTRLLGRPISDYAAIKSGDNTAVTLLEVEEDGTVEVRYINDDSHLPPELLRSNYTGRGAATNFNFLSVNLPRDKAAFDEVCQAMCGEFPDLYTPETICSEVQRALEQDAAFVCFPALLERRCGMVVLRRDSALPEDHGLLSLVYVSDDLRSRGYCEQAAGEAIDLLRRRGCHWMVVEDTADPHIQQLLKRFCFEPMESPEGRTCARMALTVPGLDEPVY